MQRLIAALALLLLVACARKEDECAPYKSISENPTYVAELEAWVERIHAAGLDSRSHGVPAKMGRYAINFESLSFKDRLPPQAQAQVLVEFDGRVSGILLGTAFVGLLVENSDEPQHKILREHLSHVSERTSFVCIPRN